MHKSESEVAQLCPTLSDPMDCGPPGSSVHGIFQARILEWIAIAFCRQPLQIHVREEGMTFQTKLICHLGCRENVFE